MLMWMIVYDFLRYVFFFQVPLFISSVKRFHCWLISSFIRVNFVIQSISELSFHISS